MSQGRNQTTIRAVDVRFVLLVAALVAAALVMLAAPARSATQNIEVGNFYYGSQGTINATVGDQLVFIVVQGNHTVDIAGLGVASGQFNKDDPPFVVNLQPGDEGTFTIQCAIHQNHSAMLEVAPAPPPPTTTTTTTTTTSTTTTSTTTTSPPGGSTTTTTTAPPGGSTTTTTAPPPGVTTTTSPGSATTTTAAPGSATTLPPDVSTTLGVGGVSTTSAGTSSGPGVPGAEGDTPNTGDQALGITSPAIDDAGWVRPLWWTVLGASIVGLVWVAIAWRRRPTEYD